MKKVLLSILAIAATSSMMAVETHFSVAFGYSHNFMRSSTNLPGVSKQDLKDWTKTYNFDGFEVGGLVDLDLAQKNSNIFGLQLGLMYTFGDYNYLTKDKDLKKDYKDEVKAVKDAGGKFKMTSHNYMHALSIPVRFKYTYQINDAWALDVITGPEIRLNVALEEIETSKLEMDGLKTESYSRYNEISGKYNEWSKVDGEKTTDKGEYLDKDNRTPMFDLAWGFGIGASWKALSLNFRYDLGMMNMISKSYKQNLKDAGYKYTVNRDAISLTLAYRIK